MIYLKSKEHLFYIKEASCIAADTLSLLSSATKPGITGLELDKMAENYIRSRGAIPSCLNYKGFPNSVCISINSGAVHCLPNSNQILEGDVVKLDLVVNYNGWNADSAITVLVPPVRPEVRKLAETTYIAMLDGISACIEGNRVTDISKAIYDARGNCSVIKPFSGHGIGKDIHESPQIPNYVVKEKDSLLVAGMVLCVEPIFSLGQADIYMKPDDWNTWTLDGSMVSHWEHTIIVNPYPQLPSVLTIRSNENIP